MTTVNHPKQRTAFKPGYKNVLTTYHTLTNQACKTTKFSSNPNRFLKIEQAVNFQIPQSSTITHRATDFGRGKREIKLDIRKDTPSPSKYNIRTPLSPDLRNLEIERNF